MLSFLVEGVCFPASLAFFGHAATLLVGVPLGVLLVIDLLGLFLSFFSWMASPESWRDFRWTMAFLLVKDFGSTPESTPGGGKGVDETLLGSLEAPPDLSGLGPAPGSTSRGGGGVDELLLDFLAAPPDLPCSGLDPILDSAPRDGEGAGELLLDLLVAPPSLSCSGLDPTLEPTGTGDEGVGGLLPDLLMAPPDLSCPELDPVLNLTPCEGGGVCEFS